MCINKIFKAYDIRGIYPDEINEDVAFKIGQATTKFLKAKELIVGRDNRLSSDSLSNSLINGITDQGVNVIDAGLITTPAFYYSSLNGKFKGGIMITASHNPKEYNGFKIIGKKAISIGINSGLLKIKKLAEKNKFRSNEKGEIKKVSIYDSYIKNVLRFIKIKDIKEIKVVIDTCNGVAGKIIPMLFEKLPCELIHINSELDGNLINSSNENLQEKVLIEKADLGVCFDGDGDRILFIDDNGDKIDPDLISALLINYLLPNKGKIVHTTASSRNLTDQIEKTNNIAIDSKVGHTFVQQEMKNEKAIFACESSGHYFLKENNYLESPLIILLKILEIVSKRPLSSLIEPFNIYSTERINIKVNNKKAFKKLKRRIKRKYKKTTEIYELDGISVERKTWWFNIRMSNTEPIIKIIIEAKRKDILERKKEELFKLIPF